MSSPLLPRAGTPRTHVTSLGVSLLFTAAACVGFLVLALRTPPASAGWNAPEEESEAETACEHQALGRLAQEQAWEEQQPFARAVNRAGCYAHQVYQYEEAVQHFTCGLGSLAGDLSSSSSRVCADTAKLAAVLHTNRAAAHMACNRHLHALADYFKAEELNPTGTVYRRRSNAFMAVGAWTEAARDATRAQHMGVGREMGPTLALAQRYAQAGQLPNYHAVLGIPYTATPAAVRAAYRQLAAVFHPDRACQPAGHGGGLGLSSGVAHTIFRLLSEAYTALG